MKKNSLEPILKSSVFLKFINFLENLDSWRSNQVRVLTYHLIEDAQGFEQQMKFLANNCFVASMHDLVEACQGHSILPSKTILITFDDAYRNFEECAWPILKSYSLPVSIFVPTIFPGNNEKIFWWDKLEHAIFQTCQKDTLQTPFGLLLMRTRDQRKHAFKHLRNYVKTLPHRQALAFVDHLCEELDFDFLPPKVLSWDSLRRLSNEGVTLGAHTQTHPLMNRISIQEARSEVNGCLNDLQREIGITSKVFAYPDGQYTPEVIQVVKDAGFVMAFTTQPGINDLNHPELFLLRRNNIGRRATQPILRARLLEASVYSNRFSPIQGY